MPQQTSPFTETKWGWNYGEAGWNSGMDENLLKMGFMFDGNVDSIVASLPAAVNGNSYFLTTDNRFYFAVGSTFYSSPCPKHFVFKIKSSGDYYEFNGTSAVQIDNPSQVGGRLDSLEATIASLGSAAFEDVADLATQAELDIASAQANGYTDILRSDLANSVDPAKGAGMVGFKYPAAGSVPRNLFDRGAEVVRARDFGAIGNGSVNDTIAIQAAIDAVSAAGGGYVDFVAGTFIASGLTLKSGVVLRGRGARKTIIKAPDGWSAGNVIDSYGFDTYKTGATDANTPVDIGFINVVLDGNAENYAGTATATAGVVCRLASPRLVLDGLRVQGGPGIGLHTSLGSVTRSVTDWFRNQTPENVFRSVEVYGCKNDGWVFDGPGDAYIETAQLGVNGWPDTTYTASRPSLIEPGRRVANFVANTAVEIGWMHSFGCREGWGFIGGRPSYGSGTKRIKWTTLISESCNGGVWMREGAYYQGGILDLHNNYGQDAAPYFLDDGLTLQGHIDNVQVDAAGNNNAQDLIRLSGQFKSIGYLDINGANFGSQGVVIGGYQNKVLRADIARCKNAASPGTVSAVRILSTASEWTCRAHVRDCDIIATMDAGAGRPVDSTIIGAFGNGSTDFVGFSAMTTSQRRNILLHNLSGDKRSRGYFGVSADVAADSTTLKTVEVPISALFAPNPEEIQISLQYVSGSAPDVTQCTIAGTTINSTRIQVYLKFAATGTGVVRINASVS